MKLQEVIDKNLVLDIKDWDQDLILDIQRHLVSIGYLNPKQVTGWEDKELGEAFAKFKQDNNQSQPSVLGAGSAKLLQQKQKEGKEAIELAATIIKTPGIEGLSLSVYPDPHTKEKPYTVGYGSTRTLEGKEWVIGQKITLDMAERLLLKDLDETRAGCVKIPCWPKLNKYQQACLLSFAYNVGANFYGGKNFNTITRVLKEEKLDQVPNALRLYVNPGSSVEKGLKKRRELEISYWNFDTSKPGIPSPNQNLAQRVVKVCEAKGYKLLKGQGEVNIIGIEGVNPDGTDNKDNPDGWNDSIGLLTFIGGQPKFLCIYRGTTEPGIAYTNSPPNPNGVARLQLGQHPDLWAVGQHRGYEAMQQVGKAIIVRDKNRNHSRDDAITIESGNGINLHTSRTTGWKGSAGDTITTWSAGCWVIKSSDEFLNFMKLIKQSAQYKANKASCFTPTLLWRDWL